MSGERDWLRFLADTADRSQDLPAALRTSELAGAETVADRLAAGADMESALAGVLPPHLLIHLLSGHLPLAVTAPMLLDEEIRRGDDRQQLATHLGYPLASLVVVGMLALVIGLADPPDTHYAGVASAWWCLVPAILAAVVLVAPWMPGHWRLPGGGWARHQRLARTWARASLALRFRITEAQAQQVLGVDLAALGPVLAAPHAVEHCTTLATWHRQRSQRLLAWTARIAAALILAIGGALVLASMPMWTGAEV